MPITITDNGTQNNHMTYNGHGQVSAVPDIATIRLGVQTIGANLVEAQTDNARISQVVLEELNQKKIFDINTFQYLVEKNFEYENGTRIDKGYSVRNIFEFKISDLAQVGSIIDTAVENGANVIEFVSFDVSDPHAYYLQALNMAVLNAFQKAKSVSQLLSLSMNPVPIRITENSTVPIPFSANLAMREVNATPMEPGNKLIDSSVTVEFVYE